MSTSQILSNPNVQVAKIVYTSNNDGSVPIHSFPACDIFEIEDTCSVGSVQYQISSISQFAGKTVLVRKHVDTTSTGHNISIKLPGLYQFNTSPKSDTYTLQDSDNAFNIFFGDTDANNVIDIGLVSPLPPGTATDPTAIKLVSNITPSGYSIINAGTAPTAYLKTLVAGSNTTLSSDANSITIAANIPSTLVETVEDSASLTGVGLVEGSPASGPSVSIKKLIAGDSISLTDNGDSVTVQVVEDHVDIVTVQDSASAGVGLVEGSPAAGPTVNIKNLRAGTNVTLTDNGTNVLIDATGSVNTVRDAVSGTGTGTLVVGGSSSGPTTDIKKLIAGTNVTLTNGTNDVTINATTPASITTIQNSATGGGNGLVIGSPSTGPTTSIKTISAGTNITFADDGQNIAISSTGGGSSSIVSGYVEVNNALNVTAATWTQVTGFYTSPLYAPSTNWSSANNAFSLTQGKTYEISFSGQLVNNNTTGDFSLGFRTNDPVAGTYNSFYYPNATIKTKVSTATVTPIAFTHQFKPTAANPYIGIQASSTITNTSLVIIGQFSYKLLY